MGNAVLQTAVRSTVEPRCRARGALHFAHIPLSAVVSGFVNQANPHFVRAGIHSRLAGWLIASGLLFGCPLLDVLGASVDDFDTNQTAITGAGQSTQDGGMLGGERDVQVTVSSGTVTAAISGGVLKVTGDGSANGTVTIAWDGEDDDAAALANSGLGGQDLAAGGADALLLGINSLTGSPTLTLTIFSGANSSTTALNSLLASPVPQVLRVAYSAIVGSANFASVGAVQLQISGLAGATIELDFLSTGSSSAPTPLDATLTDVLLVDNDGDGKASAGDTIRYVARIKNTGNTALNNVQFNAPAVANASAPANTTATPVAQTDGPASDTSAPGQAFHGAFNQVLNIASGSGLLLNDFKGLPAGTISSFGVTSYAGTAVAEAVTTHGAGTTANFGGNALSVSADGSISLTPSSTFTGLIVFQYRLANPAGSSDATATLAIGARPNANDDAYTATGNIQITHNAANGVLLKATADGGDAIAVTSFGPNLAGVANHSPGSAGLTASNGNLTLNADGSFTYNPPPGFVGADSFVYRINNGFNQPDTATVTMTVSDMIWFINNGAGAGDGRLSSPFNSLAAFVAVNNGTGNNPKAGQSVFIYTGTGEYVGTSAAGLGLLNNQKVIGQGANAADLPTATGITPASGSASLPALGGTDPIISNSTAAGHGISLAQGNTIRGLTVGNTPNGFGFSGGNAGLLTIQDCSKSGTGGALTLGSGTTAEVTFDSVASSGATAQVINLASVAGTVTINGGSITSPAGAAVNISGGTVSVSCSASVSQTANNAALVSVSGGHGTGTITFQTGTLNATTGTGLQFDNADGTYNFNGTTTLNGGDAGIDILNGSTGTFSFGPGTSITNPSGTAFQLSGATPSNTNVTYSGNISDNSGYAIDIDNHDAGSITFQTGTLTSTGQGLRVLNCGGGTLNFSNPTKALNTGANPAVTLTSNTGATINFTGGGLDIDTTSGAGFSATGGGTVTVQGTGNSITSGTGTALNISSTTIGASGCTFQSIAANGAANGIVLSNTGSSAGLTVTGDGGGSNNGSGGIIQNCTGVGVVISNSRNVNLAYVNITNSGTDGMTVNDINGLSLTRCNITDNSSTSTLNHNGIRVGNFSTGTGVNGTIAIANCNVTFSPHDNLAVGIGSGTSTWTITGSTFSFSGGNGSGDGSADAGGNNGVNFEFRNAAVVTSFTFTGNTVEGNYADGMQISPASGTTGSLVANISNNTWRNNNIHLDLNGAGSSTVTYTVSGNSFLNDTRRATGGVDGASHAMNLFMDSLSTAGALINARIENNVIGNAAIDGSGSSFGNGIRVNFNGNGQGRVLLNSNQIYECPQGRGVETIGRNGTGQLDVTLTNNTVDHTNAGFNPGTSDFELSAIFIQSNVVGTSGYTVRSDVRNNTVPATAPDGDLLAAYIALLETSTSNHQLVDNPAGPGGQTPTQQLQGANTGSASANAGVSLIAGPINTPP